MLILNRDKVHEILELNPNKKYPHIKNKLGEMTPQQVWNLLTDDEQSKMIELFFTTASNELGKCLYSAICKEFVR